MGDLSVSAEYFDSSYFGWQGDQAARSARVVVPMLCELLSPGSVVDVGCGSAAWLEVFVAHGVEDVIGIDGPYVAPESLRIPPERFLGRDLSEPFALERTFDLAISLEAAHYVPAERAAAFVSSCAALSEAILFSSAIPHQKGGPGLNRQWPGYWCELFAEHGLVAIDWLRPLVWEDEGVDWWYAQNSILYLSAERLASLFPGRQAGALPLVHPGLLAELADPTPDGPVPPPDSGLAKRLGEALRLRR